MDKLRKSKTNSMVNQGTRIEIKTTVTHLDSLSEAKPQTTLKLLEDIKALRMSDLVFDDDDEPECVAPEFGADEKLYNNLVALDVNVDCPLKGKSRVREVVKRDAVPNILEFGTHCSLPEYSFHRVISDDLGEIRHPVDGHSIYNLLQKWKKA